MSAVAGDMVVVMSGFPRRSETFALNELLALRDRGAVSRIFATKPGDGSALQPGAQRLLADVELLPSGTPAKQAAALAQRLDGERVSAVHAYFAHVPAEVARAAAARLDVPFGFSVHALDARKVTPEELGDRARAAACVVACNPDVAQDVRRAGAGVHLIPHGVDLTRFAAASAPAGDGPLALLAVGRLVPKKGFDTLIAAVALLEVPFTLRIVGEGPLRATLEQAIGAAGLRDRVTLVGAQTHAELPAEYARAHVVVTPSIVDGKGDRDGLPNVVLEAMASGRAVVATDVGAITSAISHDETGLLVKPGDAVGLAAALERLARRPALRAALAQRARARVERDFELGACTDRLHDLLESAYA